MQLRFPHSLKYKHGLSSIEEVIANLNAQKRLVETGVALLVNSADGLEVSRVEIRVVELREGSFLTELLVVLYGEYQTNVEDAVVSGIEKMFGVDIPGDYEPLVTLATLAVTYWVARFAYDKVRAHKRDHPASTHIEGEYNTVVNILGSTLQVPPEKIEAALQKTVPTPKQRSLLSSVANFLRPRKDGKLQAIEVRGVGEIEKDTIAELPDDIELAAIDASRNLDLPNVRLDIRAIDRDSQKHWGATIMGDRRFKKRLPMDIYPTVDREELANHRIVRGDIVLEGDTNSDGEFKPKRIHLLSFKSDKQPSARSLADRTRPEA
jgi:hypothetical protein